MMNEVEVQEKKSNNKIIFIIIAIVVLVLGGIGFYCLTNKQEDKKDTKKVEKKKEEKEDKKKDIDDDPGYIDYDDDKPITIPEWGNRYYDYINKSIKGHSGTVEGYFIDFVGDSVPELVLLYTDENDNNSISILYYDNGAFKETKKYDESYLMLFYDKKNDKVDNWYMYTYDSDFNDVYVDVAKLINRSSVDRTFKVTNEEEKTKLVDSYVEIPFYLDEFVLNKDFDKEVLTNMIKQYYKVKIPSDDVLGLIKESLEESNN